MHYEVHRSFQVGPVCLRVISPQIAYASYRCLAWIGLTVLGFYTPGAVYFLDKVRRCLHARVRIIPSQAGKMFRVIRNSSFD